MDPKKEYNFLIIRLSSMGDILLTTPLVRALFLTFPNAKIDFVVKSQFAPCLVDSPYINNLYCFDSTKDNIFHLQKKLQNNHYKTIIDLHGNFRSFVLKRGQKSAQKFNFNKHVLKRFLLVKYGLNLYKNIRPVYLRYIDSVKKFNIKYDGQGLDFFINKSILDNTTALLKNNKFYFSKKTICIAPGASFKTKRWPVENFAHVAAALQSKTNAQILLLGGPSDTLFSQQISQACSQPVINFTGQLSIQETGAAMSFSHLVLTNDTGLMHMANALKKPTIALFGPTTKELGFSPLPELSTVIETPNLSCRPCTHMGSHTCPKKHFKCMLDISPKIVFEKIANKLDSLS
jgi:lipopolysaccharide heptosyltransferase II